MIQLELTFEPPPSPERTEFDGTGLHSAVREILATEYGWSWRAIGLAMNEYRRHLLDRSVPADVIADLISEEVWYDYQSDGPEAEY